MSLGTLARLLPDPVRLRLRAHYHHLRDRWALRRATVYDRRVYAAGSGLFRATRHAASLEASLIKAYHRIEKGLALREPRPGFGRDAVDTVLADVAQLLDAGAGGLSIVRALNTLDEYVRFNRRAGSDLSWLEPRLAALRARAAGLPAVTDGGTVEVTREQIHAAARHDMSAFFAHRYSVRQFSDQPVDPGLIRQAVLMAQKTPSVCNRESGTVYAAYDARRRAELLALQNGNRGFGDQAGCVLVVTARLDTLLSVGERYQGWIDGGLYAMSLVYALHALGLGSCCLNWSVEPEADVQFKRLAGIPADQQVIMLIAVGHLPERLRVAQSPRRPIDTILKTL